MTRITLSRPSEFSTTISLLALYLYLVRTRRFNRRDAIQSRFSEKHPPSSMTVGEAHQIVRELRELEFPYSMHNAMKLSLLKTASIPTMTKLFVATGQLNAKNAPKRAADTEIVLSEVHDRLPGSDAHLAGIARMNYLHARYRKAGKVLDEDMLHTLGSAVVDIVRTVDGTEWRALTHVERCAVGVFHKALGDAMQIRFEGFLPSGGAEGEGWRDGAHFVDEICEWTMGYEKRVAVPTESTRTVGGRLVGLATCNVPGFMRGVVERVVASKLDGHVRVALGLQEPGPILTSILRSVLALRRLLLRHLSLPRPDSKRVRVLNETPNPTTGLWNTQIWVAHPWYLQPTFLNRWGLKALVIRLFGTGAVPSAQNEYREAGYDVWTIGPTAQEGRGRDEMEVMVAEMKAMDYAGGCPFHA
ncbi:hypothetical protein P168DRAFT_283622 [Aspergillus campestris IBT 28561]|uniref:ER-bound oxygenase mpaB/mpaB'/Rubber oxygenase catalytic domain-containing protein n=1 Tax=Aspergillus campestris (strain IBT 28561) TaxID=1392248 RepID=A0A2I1CZ52_ASPC2|nr:uncharacterized protein P168DRAFT_283622 [Aspergillus campestris IBT 28561]PKY02886.1 hypothetical protein P168DRAFT_283622 [Aspergillus campestris IBT 28561]